MHLKRNKKPRMTTLLGIAAFLCIIGYFTYTIVVTQISIAQKEQELELISARVEAQQIENDELAGVVESDDEAAYMERIAREKLGYAMPGERFYVDMSGE